MKKSGLLNPALCAAIARLGHTDGLVICDAGLPIPVGPERIDLSVIPGLPPFVDVLSAILDEVQVERAVLASEYTQASPAHHAKTMTLLNRASAAQGSGLEMDAVTHEAFKRLVADCKAVIRTGECTPYANIILYSGVPF
ncbi:D-ribose pyranase [Rhodospirillum sp. A1_3_36]|uniref:D-ribose pyranase n=1 Tax=Rhodospirillum sp. A1_3_36 TaxID=3391666 RepID=UPI0039A7511C